MPAKLTGAQLLLISKGDKKTINSFRLGAHLASSSGHSIDELRKIVSRDRYRYARDTLRCARWAATAAKPQYRVVLARSYYAMYHAARAVVFFIEGGDDYEAHVDLPGHMPADFPNRAQWENELKSARFERNRADYDPYPKTDRAFASVATVKLKAATDFLAVAKRYLIRKGCTL